MMENFWSALSAKLLTDATLVGLVGDVRTGTKDIRIGRSLPVKQAKYPYLAFSAGNDEAMIPDAFTGFKSTIVRFDCIAKDELTSIKIGDRIETLLHRSGVAQNVQYFNISNSVVMNNWTLFLTRSHATFNDETDAWTTEIMANFKWHLK